MIQREKLRQNHVRRKSRNETDGLARFHAKRNRFRSWAEGVLR